MANNNSGQQANAIPQGNLNQLTNGNIEHRMQYPFSISSTGQTTLPQHLPDSRALVLLQAGASEPKPLSANSQDSNQVIEEFKQNDKESALSFDELKRKAEDLAKANDFCEALKYYEQLARMDPKNGHIWNSLGHCYLLVEKLPEAFNAYQEALYNLPDVKDPQLWYGIGLLYEKVLSLLMNSLKAMNIQYQLLALY
jgi:tetratricopeptide (TPR) repeat protein